MNHSKAAEAIATALDALNITGAEERLLFSSMAALFLEQRKHPEKQLMLLLSKFLAILENTKLNE